MKKTILCAALALGISLLGINAFSENISGKDSMFGNGIKCQQITGCADSSYAGEEDPPIGTYDTRGCQKHEAYRTVEAKDMQANLSSNKNCEGTRYLWGGLTWTASGTCGIYNECVDWYEPEA